jgi:hypothetical protein
MKEWLREEHVTTGKVTLPRLWLGTMLKIIGSFLELLGEEGNHDRNVLD